jgi:hypothetical protein
MADPIATTISIFALAVSSATAWLTLFRRGTVKMTQPTVIYLGPDAPRGPDSAPPPKVYLRALLFSTSKRGRIVESMHVSLTRNESSQNFNIWVYGDDKLVRGSGLFIGDTGVAANHHFLTPKDGSKFQFVEGAYTLKVFAKILGDTEPVMLLSQRLEIARDDAQALKGSETGLYFDWGADSERYIPHVEQRRPSPDPEDIMKLLGLSAKASMTKSRPKS